MTPGTIMKETAVLLIFCDNRAPMPDRQEIENGAQLSADSVVALPMKRERLRNGSKEHEVFVKGEVIIELEKDSDMQHVLNSAIAKLLGYDAQLVVSLDRAGLTECGLFIPLITRLDEKGISFVDVEC